MPAVLASTTLSVSEPDGLGAPANVLIGPYVDAGWVYWVQLADAPSIYAVDHTATIERVASTGGAAESVATFGVRFDREANVQIAFDEAHLYWVSDSIGEFPGETNGAVMRADKDGSNPTTLLGGLFRPSGVAIVGGKLLFGLNGKLASMSVDGTGLETFETTSPLSFTSGRFAVSSADFFEIAGTGLGRVSMANGTVTSLVTFPAFDGTRAVEGIAESPLGGTGVRASIDATHPTGSGQLVAWAAGGGATTVIADGFPSRAAWHARTAIDGSMVYFTSFDSVLRVPLTGGTPETVGPTANTGGIAFDATHVYWTSWDATTGTIRAACK